MLQVLCPPQRPRICRPGRARIQLRDVTLRCRASCGGDPRACAATPKPGHAAQLRTRSADHPAGGDRRVPHATLASVRSPTRRSSHRCVSIAPQAYAPQLDDANQAGSVAYGRRRRPWIAGDTDRVSGGGGWRPSAPGPYSFASPSRCRGRLVGACNAFLGPTSSAPTPACTGRLCV